MVLLCIHLIHSYNGQLESYVNQVIGVVTIFNGSYLFVRDCQRVSVSGGWFDLKHLCGLHLH